MDQLNRITYVEDDPDIRAVAEIALQDVGGFTLNLCASGTEALKNTPEFQPDLILLDVMMPEMDGIQTFEALRQIPELASTPVAFMTAKVQRHEVEKYMQLGAAAVIAKPFDPLLLAEEVRNIWHNLALAET